MRAACLVKAPSRFLAFLMTSQFSTYLRLNLDFPRERLGMLYFSGDVILAEFTRQVPAPHKRSSFRSLKNIVQDLTITVTAIVSNLMLDKATDGKLLEMHAIAWLSATTAVAPGVFTAAIERVRERKKTR